MKAVIQRVKGAQVEIGGATVSKIGQGLLILLGVAEGDTEEDLLYVAKKASMMRIFSDAEDKMNLSLKDIGGEALIVSQFTLLSDTKKGNRPAFTEAARPEKAVPLYQAFVEYFRAADIPTKTGEFGADMQVSLLNDGPVTIILDSKNK